ncbi:MFS transporter [Pseudomonas nicosulfuronedens]|uniref:MFS transporter n=1 Tax=Pseudomonas nicosulfuronedens TaxID=2571105 RepID=A0A5R9QNP3_9PSED|nr:MULTISPECIES: MFS transporter [Pseudomonas]TLX71319.1 MFS transporter [Pseudomonas nicosulfuronedens]
MTIDTRPSPTGGALKEWREQWRLGTAALVGTAVSFSVWPSLSSLFIAPLQDSFGWSRGEIALAQNANLAAALLSPVLGRLIDRLGVRPVLLGGLLLTSLAYFLLALLQGSLPLYYVLYTFLSIVGVTTSGLSYTRVVNGAFVSSRGLALAMTRSGLALSGALLPSLIFGVISWYGWRMGFVTLGALILILALPSSWLWIRGASVAPLAGAGHSGSATRPSWFALLGNRRVLLICLAASLSYAPIVALLSQFQPLLTGKGLAAGEAAAAIGLVGLSALAGALLTGLLVDRFWAPLVACVFTLGPALGCLILLQPHLSTGMAVLALVLLGLGQGAEIDLLAFMVARYFGLRSYAAIYGLSVLFIAALVALAGSLIGQAYDRFGNYDLALLVASGCFLCSSLSYLALGRYPDFAAAPGLDDGNGNDLSDARVGG